MSISSTLKNSFPQFASSTGLLQEIESINNTQEFDKGTIILKEDS